MDLPATASTASPCKPFALVGVPTYTGSLDFTGEGNCSATMSIMASSAGTYSAACLGLMGTTCSDFIRGFSQPDAAVSGTCTASPSGDCTCSTTTHTTTTDQGTCTIHETAVVMTLQNSSTPTIWDYCVQGNTLRMHSIDPSTSDAPTIFIVATRQ